MKQISAYFKNFFNNKNIVLFKCFFTFSLVQIKNCWASIITYVLCFITQPLVLIIFYTLNLNIVDNSLIIFLAPLIINFLFLLILSMRLFSENRFNYIDSLMITKPIKRYLIYSARLSLIFLLCFIVQMFITLFALIFLLALGFNTEFLAIFVANIFITPFILFIVSLALMCLSVKLKQAAFSITGLTLILVFTIPSLLTRTMIKNNDIVVSYQDKEISFANIYFGDANKSYLASNVIDAQWLDIAPQNFIGNTNVGHYFIPSEFALTFYSSLFANMIVPNQTDFDNDALSLITSKFKTINLNSFDVNENTTFVFRPTDVNPFALDNFNYQELLKTNIDNINSIQDGIDLKDSLVLDSFLNKLKTSIIWNSQTLSMKELNTLKAMTGVNVEFNQMFYLIKYFSSLQNKIADLKDILLNSYNASLYDTLLYIWTNERTYANIFITDDVLATKTNINTLYPYEKILEPNKPISRNDKLFITNDLIGFTDANAFYLNADGNYSYGILQVLQNYDNSIVDKESWINFVDKISITMTSTQAFLDNLKENVTRIYNFKLTPNVINIFKYSNFLELINEPYLVWADLYIIMIVLLFPLLLYFSCRRYNLGLYSDI